MVNARTTPEQREAKMSGKWGATRMARPHTNREQNAALRRLIGRVLLAMFLGPLLFTPLPARAALDEEDHPWHPTNGYTGPPLVMISPTSGPPDTLIELTGFGFAPRILVTIRASRPDVATLYAVGTVRTDRLGTLREVVSLPAQAAPGERWQFEVSPSDRFFVAESNPFTVLPAETGATGETSIATPILITPTVIVPVTTPQAIASPTMAPPLASTVAPTLAAGASPIVIPTIIAPTGTASPVGAAPGVTPQITTPQFVTPQVITPLATTPLATIIATTVTTYTPPIITTPTPSPTPVVIDTPIPAEPQVLPTLVTVPPPAGAGPTVAPPTVVPEATIAPTPTPTATISPVVLGPSQPATPSLGAWTATFFDNETLSGQPVASAQVAEVDFDWNAGAPMPQLPPDSFSARFEQTVNLPAGFYALTAQADDGIRVYVNGELVIDEWHLGEPTLYRTGQQLSGQTTFMVEYYEAGGQASLRFDRDLMDSFPEWRAAYYENISLAGEPVWIEPAETGPDAQLSYTWSLGSPVPGVVPEDNWSGRWTGTFEFEGGDYEFRADANDGVRVWLDDVLIIDEWNDGANQAQTTFNDLGPGSHTVRVDYYERGGIANVRVWWDRYPGP